MSGILGKALRILELTGPNVTGAKIGLSVPGYMDIDSIEDLEVK